jgi:hypothetical protein
VSGISGIVLRPGIKFRVISEPAPAYELLTPHGEWQRRAGRAAGCRREERGVARRTTGILSIFYNDDDDDDILQTA